MSQFTDSVTEALQSAFAEAQKRNHTEVTENHLLWAFLNHPQDYFYSILTNLSTQPQSLLQEVKLVLDRLPTFSSPTATPPNAARNLQSRLADAQHIAESWKDSYTGSDHFLISYWKNGGEPFASWKKTTSPFPSSSGRTNQENSRRQANRLPHRRIKSPRAREIL